MFPIALIERLNEAIASKFICDGQLPVSACRFLWDLLLFFYDRDAKLRMHANLRIIGDVFFLPMSGGFFS